MTDVDRLHWVVQNFSDEVPVLVRAKGRTYASCHYLAGLLGTVEDDALIVWDLPVMNWVYHIRPMVAQVLEEYGYQAKWINKYVFRCMNKTIVFMLYRDRERHRGLEYYLVETYGETPYYARVLR